MSNINLPNNKQENLTLVGIVEAISKNTFSNITDFDENAYKLYTKEIIDLSNYISKIISILPKLIEEYNNLNNKILIPEYTLAKDVQNINTLFTTGGSQNKDIMELIRDGEFFNMTTTLHDNIMNMINKSD
jgi:hypothetical protein